MYRLEKCYLDPRFKNKRFLSTSSCNEVLSNKRLVFIQMSHYFTLNYFLQCDCIDWILNLLSVRHILNLKVILDVYLISCLF